MTEERHRFEALLLEYTGRDIDYHTTHKTTGLEFAWLCFQEGCRQGEGIPEVEP